ncbi:MAG: hypothetical protein FWF00_03330 [Endomicrobia bacterium]|nr:hypothetical protein [Endomicrobiia bacterium]MCL2506709.1 hypothetical protein [Endomicrobiia bacterium]
MQNTFSKIRIILIFVLILTTQFSFGASGRRKHFLSHGPGVASFGAGETVFSGYKDPSIIQYNPSAMAFFQENAVNISRFNLHEGSGYNAGSAVISLGGNYFIGLSASNLSSGNIEIRDDIYHLKDEISINTWNYVLSGAGYIDSLDLAYGLSVKYLYYDFYLNKTGTFAVDAGVSKFFAGPEIFSNLSKIKLGFSAQNFVSGEVKMDSEVDEIPAIYKLSSAITIPVYYRFQSQDSVSLYADLRYEDEFLDIYAGASYTIADKYSVRAGYYPGHFTFGFGVDFYFITFDYSADFGSVDLVNRFGLTFRWGKVKNPELAKEAKEALSKEKITLNEAEKRFKEAKKFYDKKEYLRATDMLSAIVLSYPSFESPMHFYTKINDDMRKTAYSNDELDFAKLTYARAYSFYYNAEYKEALNEWNKFIHFNGGNEEINEYKNRIDNALKLEQMKKREAELTAEAEEILQSGIVSYNAAKWVSCIKTMEKLQKFVSDNNFSKSVEYYAKAKQYINQSVLELSKTIKIEVTEPKVQDEKREEAPREIDEESADKKYNEGLILYAQGRYFEAERTWELTLRLNPNHQKAKIALNKMRKNSIDH